MHFAEEGCPLAIAILKEYSQTAVKQLLDVSVLLNPNIIVIGGDLCHPPVFINKYLQPGFQADLCKVPFGNHLDIKIEPSEFGRFSVAIGATGFILSNLLQAK
ncbi:MAG: ROK family protein [Bacteroidales bacterium]|nr:ROK family protein [Bacteroidales bacterium]